MIRRRSAQALALVAALAALAAGPAAAQFGEPDDNTIGLFVVEDVMPDRLFGNASYSGPANTPFAVYAVLMNPVNEHTGSNDSNARSDIDVVGGFEFKLELPGNVLVLGVELPPRTLDVHPGTLDFSCGTNLPVNNRQCTLVAFTMMWLDGQAELFLAPVDGYAAIPGALAITDYNDSFRLNEARPVSGDLDWPVFCMGDCEGGLEDAAWSEVKTLYR